MDSEEQLIILPSSSADDIVKLDTFSMTVKPLLPFTLNFTPLKMMHRFELIMF